MGLIKSSFYKNTWGDLLPLPQDKLTFLRGFIEKLGRNWHANFGGATPSINESERRVLISLLGLLSEQNIESQQVLIELTRLRHSSRNAKLQVYLTQLKEFFIGLDITSAGLETVIDEIYEYAYSTGSDISPYKREKMQQLYQLLLERRYRFYRQAQHKEDDEVSPQITRLLGDGTFCWSLLGPSRAKQLIVECQRYMQFYQQIVRSYSKPGIASGCFPGIGGVMFPL